MASFHCSVKVGKSGSGAAHADYIEREGKYASKSKDDLEHKESGNMPKFAETSGEFWSAADQHERANGSVYREFEIALPRELTQAQRLELVREFVEQEIGDRHAYTFAIHNPKAAIDGGEQPHAHIMFSERKRDGIERPAEQYFKRWNGKQPERGGCQKAGTAKTPTERKAELVQLRQRFAELQNKHLAKSGHSVQVTHLSLAAQGIDREVEPHFGPKLAKELAEAVKIDRGALKTPDAPKPTPEEKQAAVELYKHFRIALETGEKDRKRAYGDSVANIKAAEDARAKFRGIRDSVDADFAKLGKRPMLLAGKWDAEKARLSAVYFAAKTEEAKAQERKQEHTKQAEKYSAEPSGNDQVSAAFKALNLPPNAQTIERLRLGEQVFKEHQQEQVQARAMQREQERAQPKPDRGYSR